MTTRPAGCLVLLAVLLLALLLPSSAPTVAQQTPEFVEPFTGAPAAPQPWAAPNWDSQVHSRDTNTWPFLESMVAPGGAVHHGADCAAPPATHDVGTSGPVAFPYEHAVFQCRDHLMTALKAQGYGVIYLTPPALADFSAGEATLSVDLSTLATTSIDRDWVDLWITPEVDHLALPLDSGQPDLQGSPKRALRIKQVSLSTGVSWRAYRFENFVGGVIPGGQCCLAVNAVLDPSAERRSKLEIKLRPDHIKVALVENCWKTINGVLTDTGCRTASNNPAVWIDAPISPPLDWSQGVVQLGHHSYNPQKPCADAGQPLTNCQPNTWHWDNLRISPYVPLSIMRGGPRMVQTATQDITFPSPAPAGATLRFSAVGRVETSADQGQTWTVQTPRPSSDGGHTELAASYGVAIPQGTQSVRVRLSQNGSYVGPFHAKDFHVWAPYQAPTPTPTATVIPTDTPTPVPPTATPTNTPTPEPTATPVPPTATDVPATATPTPTSTPVPPTDTPAPPTSTPTATGTPAPDICIVRVYRSGVQVAEWECR